MWGTTEVISIAALGVWHLPFWVVAAMLPVVFLYLWDKRRRQQTLAKHHAFIRSETRVAEFQRRTGRIVRMQALFFGLAVLSGVIAFFAAKHSDTIFIVASVGALVFLALSFYLLGGIRCPICTAAVGTADKFCTACGAQLQP
jgi:hypothetical protein